MKEILKFTQQTEAEHNKLILEKFIFWAGEITENRTQWQIVLTNRPIQNWFFQEYEKLEQEFISITKMYPRGSQRDDERLYVRVISAIYTIYPGALLEEIKRKHKEIPTKNLN